MCPRRVFGGVEGFGFFVVDEDGDDSESGLEADSGSEGEVMVENSEGICYLGVCIFFCFYVFFCFR